jgi:hypothetical protein
MRKPVATLTAAALCLAACSSDNPPPPAPPCPTDARIAPAGDDGPVLEGTGRDATLWALFFVQPLTTSADSKVVWRMTGSGELAIVAAGPDGRTIEPLWVEEHGDSSFQRPGDEWGTGWRFPAAGCWTFRATRDVGSGELTVRVAE